MGQGMEGTGSRGMGSGRLSLLRRGCWECRGARWHPGPQQHCRPPRSSSGHGGTGEAAGAQARVGEGQTALAGEAEPFRRRTVRSPRGSAEPAPGRGAGAAAGAGRAGLRGHGASGIRTSETFHWSLSVLSSDGKCQIVLTFLFSFNNIKGVSFCWGKNVSLWFDHFNLCHFGFWGRWKYKL